VESEFERLDPRVDRTRVAVLHAVRELLNEDGWDAVTHARVAERSGAGRTTVYRHWPERIDLVREAFEFEFGVTRGPEPVGELRTDLIAALEAIRFELVDRDGRQMLIATIARAEFDDQVRHMKKVLLDNALQTLRKILANAIAAKEFVPSVEVEKAVAALVGPMIMQLLVTDSEVGPERTLELVDSFLIAHTRYAVETRRDRDTGSPDNSV
jgi:AcrR family transcriptional regulator